MKTCVAVGWLLNELEGVRVVLGGADDDDNGLVLFGEEKNGFKIVAIYESMFRMHIVSCF